VIIDLDEDNLVPFHDPVSHLAYAVEAADVRTVVVDGRIVLRDGMLTTADEREIRSQVHALAIGIGSFREAAIPEVGGKTKQNSHAINLWNRLPRFFPPFFKPTQNLSHCETH
jgi:hypothetical protein